MPTRGMPLGWRVGIATGVAVTIAMGTVAVLQASLARDATNAERVQMLHLVAAPLVVDIEHAGGKAEVQTALTHFRRAYVDSGLPVPEVEILPTRHPASKSGSTASLSVPVSSAGLNGGRGTLRLEMPASFGWRRDRAALAGWVLHLLATLTVVVVFLLAVLRRLVVRPLAKLVDAARKMEMGYWDAVRDPGGAWEVRWLAWRFAEMGRQLDRAVVDLVRAERAATSARATLRSSAAESDALALETSEAIPGILGDEQAQESSAAQAERWASPIPGPENSQRDPALHRLRQASDELARGLAAGAPDLNLARAAWLELASEAERRGDPGLSAQIEDLALRALHPNAYAALAQQLRVELERRRLWAKQQGAALDRLLQEAGCPARRIEHRVKSTASVYRKMQTKGLELEEVHDLFAFRVVVPTEEDCYSALGVIHRSFEPLLGRFSDYIASPKPSGYRSLHTIVRPQEPHGPIFEIQIRSVAMHSRAESGSAAHWRYKRTLPELVGGSSGSDS